MVQVIKWSDTCDVRALPLSAYYTYTGIKPLPSIPGLLSLTPFVTGATPQTVISMA